MHQRSDIRNVQWWGWPIFNSALLSYLLTVLVLPCTLRFCHCQRSSEQGASESYTADCTSTLSSAAVVSVSVTQVCQLSHWFRDTWQLTGLLGSDIPKRLAIRVWVWPASHILIMCQLYLIIRVPCTMMSSYQTWKFFPYRINLFQKGIYLEESRQEVTKIVSLVEKWLKI